MLHITSAPGGGADRYIRDVARSVPGRHLAWHVGEGVDVLEEIGPARFWPTRAADPELAAGLRSIGVVAHLHAVDRACRERLASLDAHGAMPLVVTLHDVSFVHPDAFGATSSRAVDRGWIDAVAPVLERADAVLAPSDYIASLVSRWFRGVRIMVVEPGLEILRGAAPSLPGDFIARRPAHVVAVVGAIGPHKGSASLPAIATALHEIDAAVVVLGYTDEHIMSGWAAPGLYIHGPYEDAALNGWLAAYAPTVALFPNRLPESFSYTLSEVWAAGIPALVPDEGALGERIAKHGGGWVLPAGFPAEAALGTLVRLLGPEGSEEVARVKSRIVPSDPAQVPPLPAMSSAIAAVYARYGVADGTSDASLESMPWQRLLAANLDGFVFRQELVFLCESLANMEARAQSAAENAETNRRWAERVEAELAEAKAWAAKVEGDIAVLNDEIAHRDGVVKELQVGVDWLRGEVARTTADLERFDAERRELATVRAAFDRLPRWLREKLLRRAERARA